MADMSALDVLQWVGSFAIIAGYFCFSRKDRLWGCAWSLVGCVVFCAWSVALGHVAITAMNVIIGATNAVGLVKALGED